ncbi:DUF5059 domain-containing protein [Halohasta salina]|uniref:DUF5059 domain-containing protein n=1 Tax=Halohasta salina TaxID=2961621 RepID=UPI0020A2FFE0|nr:DUF5059 domain-containing protein [Halohasta salina]
MGQKRRTMLKGSGAVLAALGLAGCTGGSGTETSGDGSSDGGTEPTALAVASEWNAIRARLWDAAALGEAGQAEAGSAVAQHVFERFESASGEYNAHELLEETSESNYEGFEGALGELRSEGLQEGNIERANEEAGIASTQLYEAQQAHAGDAVAQTLDLQLLGAALADAYMLAAAGAFEAAGTVADNTYERFENAAVYETIESTDSELYESFESAIDAVDTAADEEDLEGVSTAVADGLTAAVDGGYAVAPSETVAGVGHLATYQARGWDAAALAGLGGPSTEFAHAAALTVYRARAHDAAWLYETGQPDAAISVVEKTFAHFEGARAHEALEEASEDAYHTFEDEGLSALLSAIENDDAEAVSAAVDVINSGLVTGIEALGSGNEASLLQAGYFKARIEDAYERYQLGESAVAAETARGLFQLFEANEADFHETLEDTDEDLYHTFEEEHLNGLISAFENGEDAAVDEHVTGIRETLLEFETAAGSTAQVSAVEAGYMAARVFDAGVLGSLGESSRANAVVQSAFEQFEAGAGGFHEALEEADHDRYESFEAALGEAGSAAEGDASVSEAARTFNGEAVDAIYTVVASAGGSFGSAATSIMQDTFASFEEARVHEALEEADHDAYEGFEAALDDYIAALESGSGVDAAAEAFAAATLNAQFAVAGAVAESPVDASGSGGEESEETSLEGGPNVVEGVPEDADHVVDMQAVAFEPKELTVSQGDTVAWNHAGGEAHNVVAYDGEIPDGAAYWASGGFESEDAAVEGWENGQGAVQSGQSYVHTFETTGEHNYYCVPHEMAGMVGTVIVE